MYNDFNRKGKAFILLAGFLKRDWFKVLAVTFSKISRVFFFLQLLVNSFSIIFIIILIIIILIITHLNSYLVSLLWDTLLFITIYLYFFLFVYSFLILYSFLLHFSTFILFFDLFFALILCFQLVQQHCIIWSVIPSGLKSSEKNAKAVRRKKSWSRFILSLLLCH